MLRLIRSVNGTVITDYVLSGERPPRSVSGERANTIAANVDGGLS